MKKFLIELAMICGICAAALFLPTILNYGVDGMKLVTGLLMVGALSLTVKAAI